MKENTEAVRPIEEFRLVAQATLVEVHSLAPDMKTQLECIAHIDSAIGRYCDLPGDGR